MRNDFSTTISKKNKLNFQSDLTQFYEDEYESVNPEHRLSRITAVPNNANFSNFMFEEQDNYSAKISERLDHTIHSWLDF